MYRSKGNGNVPGRQFSNTPPQTVHNVQPSTSFIIPSCVRGFVKPLTSVMIFFLYHVFFLVLVVWHPYFHFAPSYEETDHYLLAFPPYSSSFILSL